MGRCSEYRDRLAGLGSYVSEEDYVRWRNAGTKKYDMMMMWILTTMMTMLI